MWLSVSALVLEASQCSPFLLRFGSVSGPARMLSKHSRAYKTESVPPAKRLRRNLEDLFASNIVSGSRAQELFNDAAAAGDQSVRTLLGPCGHNAARNLKRRLLKGSLWPSLYEATIPCWSPRLHRQEDHRVALLLPHEALAVMCRVGSLQKLQEKAQCEPQTAEHVTKCETEQGCAFIPVGLWGDGVPCNWDRTDSLEVLSWNLPGAAPPWKSLRLPITAVSRKNVSSETFDALLQVVAWSFQAMASGIYPSRRHDGTLFETPSDTARRKMAGQPLGHRAVLAEIRGDWKFMKEVFKFPGWNSQSGICWLCTCTKDEIREVGLDAPWRASRLSHWDLVHRIHSNGQALSPLCGAPWVVNTCFKVDWLHAVDLGVGADFVGNVLAHIIEHRRVDGANVVQRCSSLWSLLQEFYTRTGTVDKLQNLTLGMIRKDGPGKSPKLRCGAAQLRALVPWVADLCLRLLSENDPVEGAIRAAAVHLQACYAALSSESANDLHLHARLFALQAIALEAAVEDPARWRVKPKMHLFMEMASVAGARPAASWCYRDEDFGGTCASLARRRGGLLKPGPTSRNLLSKFLIKTSVPRIV